MHTIKSLSTSNCYLHGNIMQSKETSYWLISKLLEWKFGPNFQRNFGLTASGFSTIQIA